MKNDTLGREYVVATGRAFIEKVRQGILGRPEHTALIEALGHLRIEKKTADSPTDWIASASMPKDVYQHLNTYISAYADALGAAEKSAQSSALTKELAGGYARLLVDATRVEMWTRELAASENRPRLPAYPASSLESAEREALLVGIEKHATLLGELLDRVPPEAVQVRAELRTMALRLEKLVQHSNILSPRLSHSIRSAIALANSQGAAGLTSAVQVEPIEEEGRSQSI